MIHKLEVVDLVCLSCNIAALENDKLSPSVLVGTRRSMLEVRTQDLVLEPLKDTIMTCFYIDLT